MSKTIDVRVKARKGRHTNKISRHYITDGSMKPDVAGGKLHFDREVEHLPKSVIKRQAERLLKENKQALDALSKL